MLNRDLIYISKLTSTLSSFIEETLAEIVGLGTCQYGVDCNLNLCRKAQLPTVMEEQSVALSA